MLKKLKLLNINNMKKIILLSIILILSLNGLSQKIISASNPLEEILQKDFDSTILYSYSGWKSYRPNYLIIAKKDSLVFFTVILQWIRIFILWIMLPSIQIFIQN